MSKTKTAVNSMGVWGSILALGTGLVDMAQQVVSTGLAPVSWHPYLILLGSAGALIGRLRATKKIEGLF